MRSAAEFEGAHASIRILSFFLVSCVMASTMVIVFPVPGLSIGREFWIISTTGNITYGPKTTKGNEPGGATTIDVTACNCGVLERISLLTVFESNLGTGIFGRWDSSGNKTRDWANTVSRAWCWRCNGMRVSLKRTLYFWVVDHPRNDP